ncbi:DUF2149 domain-containing protein [Anaerocolumna sp.]|uniref:DUF2149 domain-containing protein n=1 Tax=Anaerocolumna sp. TaxID=2041569 RepID=UPI0028A8199B|nr:DUF2149 domain-containing protein [Anaerocolumna sp.]
MIRDSSVYRRKKSEEDVNPMDGVANLIDIMLVFACGLMVSIILHWNVDIKKVNAVIDKSQLKQIENAEIVTQDGEIIGTYESMGVAVQDPKTGKLYVIKGKNEE